jgi:hypothetical protein
MHTETVNIYFDDLDAMGVVHNGRYAILLERALGAYWTRAGCTAKPSLGTPTCWQTGHRQRAIDGGLGRAVMIGGVPGW